MLLSVFPPFFFLLVHQRLRTTPWGLPHLLKDTAKDAHLGFPKNIPKIQDEVGQSWWLIRLDQGLFAAPKPIPKSSSLHLTQPPHPTGSQMRGAGHSPVWGHSGGIGGGGVLGLILQNLLPGSKGWVKPDFHPHLQKGDFTLNFPPCTPFTENHRFIYSHHLQGLQRKLRLVAHTQNTQISRDGPHFCTLCSVFVQEPPWKSQMSCPFRCKSTR